MEQRNKILVLDDDNDWLLLCRDLFSTLPSQPEVFTANAARKDGADKLAEWKAKPESAHLSSPSTVSRDNPQKLDPKVVDAALLAKASGLPQTPEWVGVDLGSRGYAVLKVNKVVPRTDVPAERATQEQKQYTQALAAAETMAYYEFLKTEFKTQIKVPKPAPKDAKAQPN
jgi:peptidyl-prolyl cis-trans isomerase D